MGATPYQMIRYFIFPEAFGSLILSITTATISLIGATAMAGTVGGGGVGDIAIIYGYQRFDTFAMIATVIILVILVQLIQTIDIRLARFFRRNYKKSRGNCYEKGISSIFTHVTSFNGLWVKSGCWRRW